MSRSPAPGRYDRARPRPRRRQARRTRRLAVIVLLTLALLVVLVLAAFSSSPAAFQAAVPASSSRLLPAGQPQPQIVAVQQTLRLQLPIAQQRVTAIGYHAMGQDALPLTPVGRQANEGIFSRVFHRIFGGGGGGIAWYQLGGSDDGAATGAVDVGAPAGTDVYSPVTGTVVGIRDYILDGKAYGNIVEIQPQGSPSVVVSLTHLRVDASLTVGSPLTAGASRIGAVVDFSSVERQALAAHTQDAGNHVTAEVQPAATIALN